VKGGGTRLRGRPEECVFHHRRSRKRRLLLREEELSLSSFKGRHNPYYLERKTLLLNRMHLRPLWEKGKRFLRGKRDPSLLESRNTVYSLLQGGLATSGKACCWGHCHHARRRITSARAATLLGRKKIFRLKGKEDTTAPTSRPGRGELLHTEATATRNAAAQPGKRTALSTGRGEPQSHAEVFTKGDSAFRGRKLTRRNT